MKSMSDGASLHSPGTQETEGGRATQVQCLAMVYLATSRPEEAPEGDPQNITNSFNKVTLIVHVAYKSKLAGSPPC